MSDPMNDESRCTCPDPEPYDGPGVPIVTPGRSHRRGCPVVAGIFEMMDAQASEAAARHVARGGVLFSPGEAEVRRLSDKVAELRRRIERMEDDLEDDLEDVQRRSHR